MAFNTRTRFGAYLAREFHFRPDGMIAFSSMKLEPLDGYVDASGDQNTVIDKEVLTVNGALSTPELWNAFDNEWQEYLKGKCWEPNERGKYVFHATDFWADKCEYAPNGLSTTFKNLIYWHLLKLIKKYSLWRFGMGVLLDDLDSFDTDVPAARELIMSQAGTMLSKLCFILNSDWAKGTEKYEPSITYVFEAGDSWFGELQAEFNTARKLRGHDRELTVYALDSRPKDDFSPLQAADIIAWECRQYFLEVAKNKEAAIANKIKLRPQLNFLHTLGESSFAVLDGGHIETHFQQLVEQRLDSANIEPAIHLIGDGKPFADFGAYSRYLVAEVKKLGVAEQLEIREKRRREHREKQK